VVDILDTFDGDKNADRITDENADRNTDPKTAHLDSINFTFVYLHNTMGIIKPLDPETVRFNQETLQEWGRRNLDEGLRPLLMISINQQDQLNLKGIPNLSLNQLAEIMEIQAKMLRDKIKQSQA
jgi:hypothetical protein